MLNNFTKHWITITCAPDSIRHVVGSTAVSLDIIRNENNSKHVFVLSDEDCVLAMGQTFDELKKTKIMTFSEASNEIAKIFNLLVIQC